MRDSSNLLAHEAAFALGQMQDVDAIPALETVLNDLSLHPIVRHEAAEALGAIGLESNVLLLRNSLVRDPAQEVRETCELALGRIEGLRNGGSGDKDESSVMEASPFLSVDPATAASGSSVQQLRLLMYWANCKIKLRQMCFPEYLEMFTSIQWLGTKQLKLWVLLQWLYALQPKRSDDQSIALLEEFAKDPELIVSQSCEVARSMLEFEKLGKSFEYLFMQTPQVQKS